MEEVTQYQLKELRIILDSNEVKNYFQIQNVQIKEEVVSDDEPTDLQPISQVYLPEYQVKSEVDSTTSTVEQHEDKHKEAKILYSCSLCKKEKMRVNNFKQHLTGTHELSKEEILIYVPEFYKCKNSHRQFKLLSDMYRHEGTHTLPFKCDQCDKKYSEERHLQRHKLTHSEAQLPCPHCDMKFRLKTHLTDHIEIIHSRGVRNHKCDQCEKKYKCRSYLLRHIKLTHINPHRIFFKCDECGKCFPYKDSLKTHIIEVHHTVSKKYTCLYCNKKIKTMRSLKKHIKRIHNNGVNIELNEWTLKSINHPKTCNEPTSHTLPFNCDKCDKKFSKKCNLQQHKVIHCEPKIPCPHCDMKFRRKQDLSDHIECKHITYFHKCDQCEKFFKCRRYLLLHRKYSHNKSNQRSFKCDDCGKCFAFKNILKRHIIGVHHTMHKKYICPYCSMKFKTKCNKSFKRHIRIKHNSGVAIESNDCSLKPSNRPKSCNDPNTERVPKPGVSEPVGHLLELQNQHLKEKISEDDGPEIQPISEVCLHQEERKSEVDSTSLDVEHLEDKHEDTKKLFSCSLCKMNNMVLSSFKQHLTIIHHLSEEEILKYVPKFYQCKFCQRQFKTPFRLHQHEGFHTSPFKCDNCDKKFSEERYLQQHKLIHCEPKIPCPHCDMKFRRKHDLSDHIESKHSKYFHKCDQCEKFFKCRKYLLWHKKYNHNKSNQSSFKCDMCGKCFKIKNTLKRHIIEVHHTMRKKYICPYCSVKYKSNDNLKHHIKRKHNSVVPTKSNDCSLKPRNRSKTCIVLNAEGLSKPGGHLLKLQNQHLKEKNSEDHDPEIQPISEVCLPEHQEERQSEVDSNSLAVIQLEDKHEDTNTYYTCSLCNKKIFRFNNLKPHLKNYHHLSEKEILKYLPDLKCKYCQCQFKTPATLRVHESSHTLPFKCDICDQRFGRKGYLKKHKLAHSKREFPCPHCDKKVVSITNLKLHIKSQHFQNVSRYKCDQCDNIYKHKNSLQIHVESIHSGATEYSLNCDICQKYFKYKEYLKRHIISVHFTKSKFVCSFCNKKFKKNESLRLHIKTKHITSVSNPNLTSNIQNTIDILPQTIILKSYLSSTVSSVIKPQNDYCKQNKEEISSQNDGPELIQPFAQVYLQEYHEENITTEFPLDSISTVNQVKAGHKTKQKSSYPCSLCKNTYLSYRSYELHLDRIHHLSEKDILKYLPVFKCKYCPLQLKTPPKLREHEASHTLPFKCDICNRGFGRKSNLNQHKLRHDTEPQRLCPLCDMKFGSITYLNRHIVEKHKNKSVTYSKCDHCEKKYKYKRALMCHIKKSHPCICDISCDQCSKCFKCNEDLKSHQRDVHEKVTEYVCLYCSVKFMDIKYLENHMKTQHHIGVPIIKTNEHSLLKPNIDSRTCIDISKEIVSNSNVFKSYSAIPSAGRSLLKNQHSNPDIKIKEEILEGPEIQPISQVFVQECQGEHIKTEVNSPLDSTLNDEVATTNENVVEIKSEITIDEMDWSAFKTEESTL